MTKELQDLVWSVLPKEFKEEVKKIYNADDPLVCPEENEIFDYLFGEHTITSDADGVEILCVSREKVKEAFDTAKKIATSKMSSKMLSGAADMVCKTLDILFGSKCMPDASNVANPSQNSPENCDSEPHISTDCDKPAEPQERFCQREDSAVDVEGSQTSASSETSDTDHTNSGNKNCRQIKTSRERGVSIYRKISNNCDNRLLVASMAMQGILSNIDLLKNVLETGTETLSGDGISYRAVAKASLLFADALIAEAEKGAER